MKLKDIIIYLDKMARVVIWNCSEDAEEPDKAFEGFIMDIPWVYLDYYLYNDEDGEAIDARIYDSEHTKCGFVISIVEKQKCINEPVAFAF